MTIGVLLESTFLDVLQRSLPACGDRPALTFLHDGDVERPETYSFAELDGMARVVAADLQKRGVRPGDRVMLLQTPGRHMVAGFLGCMYAGVIAVPAYPPSPFLGTQGNERLLGIRKDVSATAVLTTSELLPLLQSPDEGDAQLLSWVLTDKPQSTAADYVPVEVNPGDVAFLQYTSGSTIAPRGVRVTHGALVANINMIVETSPLDQDSIGCSWLPPFHDMGLIGTILTPLAIGCRTIQMTPEAFLRRPDRWLRAIARYRATFSWAPNFAYDLCIRQIQDLDGVDLSSWILAGNAAEPVKERTLAEFSRKFADYGLRPESLWVGYGLAEATLMVSERQRGPGSTIWVDPDQLSEGRLVPTKAAYSRSLVSCGASAPNTTVTIRDPESGEILDDGIVGEIWVAGPQVCDGYWQRPALTADIFPGGVLRTGDLGAIWQGELYVTGRVKDLLIVRGRNHYPQDVEQTMEAADPNLRPGCGVAVSVPTDSGELLVLIQEIVSKSSEDPELIVEKMRRRVTEQHGISADTVVLVRPRTVPKTTSGKLRRSTAAESFQRGTLRVVHQWPANPGGSPS